MLQVEGIDVYYGDVQVLNGVTLDVKDKEFVVVIGANGAGKTTLLKTISGLLRPRVGALLLTASGSATSRHIRWSLKGLSRFQKVVCSSRK